ncbi:MAG: hypothetical protein Q7K43_02030 [Candidatus Woesearchaeota archaeon]|nr:hypothetical protein [Candidatus Woesearchaeota archaeon]
MEKDSSILPWYGDPYYLTFFAGFVFFLIFLFEINMTFFTLSLTGMLASLVIAHFSCKKCHKLGTRVLIEKQHLQTRIEPHRYIVRQTLRYSDGVIAEIRHSPERSVDERVETYREVFSCKSCNLSSFKEYEINIDKNARPRTQEELPPLPYRSPKVCVICGNKLRTRRKYCSYCKP